uniref:Uncharacterized protein n=1 Tax=Anguilla anguilla TaxID=7936 RepID=A0A0E9QCM9_ANGAN
MNNSHSKLLLELFCNSTVTSKRDLFMTSPIALHLTELFSQKKPLICRAYFYTAQCRLKSMVHVRHMPGVWDCSPVAFSVKCH